MEMNERGGDEKLEPLTSQNIGKSVHNLIEFGIQFECRISTYTCMSLAILDLQFCDKFL